MRIAKEEELKREIEVIAQSHERGKQNGAIKEEFLNIIF